MWLLSSGVQFLNSSNGNSDKYSVNVVTNLNWSIQCLKFSIILLILLLNNEILLQFWLFSFSKYLSLKKVSTIFQCIKFIQSQFETIIDQKLWYLRNTLKFALHIKIVLEYFSYNNASGLSEKFRHSKFKVSGWKQKVTRHSHKSLYADKYDTY